MSQLNDRATLPLIGSATTPPCIDRVPTEILDQILLDVCIDEPLFLPLRHVRGRPFQSCPAMLVSSVCCQWRSIALANTALWTPPTINVDLEGCEGILHREDSGPYSAVHFEQTPKQRRYIALLQCYFRRSGSTPLDMLISGSMDNEEHWEESVGAVVRTIASTTSRWKCCELPRYIADWLSVTRQVATPILLESVHIEYEFSEFRTTFFSNAPRLHSWQGPIDNSLSEKTVLPWHQLTRLIVSNSTYIEFFMRLVPHLRQLTELNIVLREARGDGGPMPMPAQRGSAAGVLPLLDSATLYMDSPRVLTRILATWTTPSLSYVKLVGTGFTPEGLWDEAGGHMRLERWPMEEFEGWWQRSRCALQRLTLSSFEMPKDDVGAIMVRVPGVVDFSIDERAIAGAADDQQRLSSVDDDLLRRLTANAGAEAELLPNLKRLTIMGALCFDYALLADMVRSRVNPPVGRVKHSQLGQVTTTLEYLKLYVDDESKADVDDATEAQLLEILGEDGFHCERGGHLMGRRMAALMHSDDELM